MKLPNFYLFFAFFSYTGCVQGYFKLNCDRMACYTDLLPKTCECCLPEGHVDIAGLQHDLNTKVFGQHIAKHVILNIMENKERIKPLVLSFHGPTGCGKTFISQILAKYFNPKGTESEFVHMISVSASFPHVTEVKTYKDQLHSWIRGNVSRCERSIFIFEEADQMHPELLNSLKSYMDYHYKIDGVSYRKSIFIFMSNTGAHVITDLALESRRQGRKREEIPLFEVHSRLSSYLQNTLQSEFHKSDLIRNNVIDVYVPFLPLELEHVKMCVRAELQRQGRREDEESINRIAEGVDYYPKGEEVFAQNGCKNVHARVDFTQKTP